VSASAVLAHAFGLGPVSALAFPCSSCVVDLGCHGKALCQVVSVLWRSWSLCSFGALCVLGLNWSFQARTVLALLCLPDPMPAKALPFAQQLVEAAAASPNGASSEVRWLGVAMLFASRFSFVARCSAPFRPAPGAVSHTPATCVRGASFAVGARRSGSCCVQPPRTCVRCDCVCAKEVHRCTSDTNCGNACVQVTCCAWVSGSMMVLITHLHAMCRACSHDR